MQCEITGCIRDRSQRRRYCSSHYKRLYRHGDPFAGRRPLVKDWLERVDQNGPIPDYRPDLGPCWIYPAVDHWGYAKFKIGKRDYKVHRLSYERFVGPIPKGLVIDHLCRIHACCNPKHLEAVTHRENDLRGFGASGVNARKTHCIRGHEFTPENTYVNASGGRTCRTCLKFFYPSAVARRQAT